MRSRFETLIYQSSPLLTFQPLLSFLTGIIILQFIKFWFIRKKEKNKFEYLKVLATFGFILHILQSVGEIWFFYISLKSDEPTSGYVYYLFEATRTSFTLLIALIVQAHFSRIAYALLKQSRKWINLACFLALLNLGGGLGTITLFVIGISDSHHHTEKKPINLGKTLTAFYLSWLTATLIFNLTLSYVIISRLRHQNHIGLQKSLREITFRLMTLTMETFSLASITELLSICFVTLGSFFGTSYKDHHQSIEFFQIV
ncbi:hypothetical protein CROQUDRAFT_721830 [Cronartium quercuum f. sp. fusiforme G11]|uniref:Uncharacterized protein n=1 Tax=Cronartium quercuum f. sp. fusiforme G11 TaxID=708437 RepID=A0A9P6NLJ5_9BASI|nr:hypothetical protein CROQUDRAFT_721830 [Cronartium quercuum f. sp. fusiforme G11]